MLLLPRTLDNNYRGQKLALWILALLAASKALMGTNVMLNGASVARSADGIPLDAFSPAAQQTVIAFFALWGLTQVGLAFLGFIALVRHRAMVPLVFAFYLVEHVARKTIFLFLPVTRVGSPPGIWINYVLIGLIALGTILSLIPRSSANLSRAKSAK